MYFSVINGALISIQDKRLIAFPPMSSANEYAVPDGILIIGDSAFYDCRRLKKISLPDSLTTIGNYAFAECGSLASINLPKNVTLIGECAFSSCDSLKELTIPDSILTIGDNAFHWCDKLTITVTCNSYAEQYCKKNGINYLYPDSLDWLK